MAWWKYWTKEVFFLFLAGQSCLLKASPLLINSFWLFLRKNTSKSFFLYTFEASCKPFKYQLKALVLMRIPMTKSDIKICYIIVSKSIIGFWLLLFAHQGLKRAPGMKSNKSNLWINCRLGNIEFDNENCEFKFNSVQIFYKELIIIIE